MPELTGLIFDIDNFAVHDGPGIRSVVYFKGCPLRCAWCHSPESQKVEPELIHLKSKCLNCPICAGKNCANGAYRVCGRYVTVSNLLKELLPQKVFFKSSGGGVTLSGGEVLYQPEFAQALLRALKEEGIHTIIETSVTGAEGCLKDLSPFTDIFYCDVKIMSNEKHRLYAGADNKIILSNIKALSSYRNGKGIVLRVPLIPTYTDGEDNVTEIYRFALECGLTEVHLLPYNNSAPAKYEWLFREYKPGKLERQNAEYLKHLKESAPQSIKAEII